MNIVLSGMPGSGKSTVLKLLSSLTGKKAADIDGLITRKYGDISAIFKEKGEEYFRTVESRTVESLSLSDGYVIACGGGCLLNKKNVENLKKNGKIVYLKTDIDELYARLSGDNTRPLLSGDMRANLNRLYKERAKLYADTADYTVCTDGLTPAEVAKKIAEIDI